MSELPDTIRTLSIPLLGVQMMLPNVAVAEVIEMREAEPVENAPDWMLGSIEWHGIRIPLIAFETLQTGAPVDIPASARIAVLNRLSEQQAPGFYALLMQGIPRSVRVSREGLGDAEQDQAGDASSSLQVGMGDARSLIPDLAAIERLVATHWSAD